MASAFRDLGGGIFGLLALPRDTWQAIEADLHLTGHTLADVPGVINWRLLNSLIRHAPRGSAIFQQVNGAAGWWDHSDYLLAAVYDTLRAANWQRSGGQGDYPEPYPRPGDTPAAAAPKAGEQHFGSGAVTVAEFNDFWNAG